MARQFPIYKGLQKPLIFRGFQGKFIGWGIGSLITGVVMGGVIGALTSMTLGGAITIGTIVVGLYYTSQMQKKGLHSKTRNLGVFQFSSNLRRKIGYDKSKEKRI